MKLLAIILALAILTIPSTLRAQSIHMPPVELTNEGPRCDQNDHDCILRALLYQTRVAEERRLRLEHCDQAKQDSEKLADLAEGRAQVAEKQAAEAPSRLRWFLLGAAGALALSLGIVIAAH